MSVPPIALDIFCVVLPLVIAIRGMRRGAARGLSGLLSLVCGLAGGLLAGRVLAKPIGEKYVAPRIEKLLSEHIDFETFAREAGETFEDVASELQSVLDRLGVSSIAKGDAVDAAVESMTRAGDSIVNSAVSVVSERLAFMTVFIAAFLVVFILMSVIFRHIVPMVARLPVIQQFDRALGLILGIASGLIVTGLFLVFVMRYVPSWSDAGGPLSEQAIADSYVVHYYFDVITKYVTAR